MTKAMSPKYNNPRIFLKQKYFRLFLKCLYSYSDCVEMDSWIEVESLNDTIILKWLRMTSIKRCQSGLMCHVKKQQQGQQWAVEGSGISRSKIEEVSV